MASKFNVHNSNRLRAEFCFRRLLSLTTFNLRGECSVHTDCVKVPILPHFGDNFPNFSPISLPYSRFYINIRQFDRCLYPPGWTCNEESLHVSDLLQILLTFLTEFCFGNHYRPFRPNIKIPPLWREKGNKNLNISYSNG